MKIVIIGHSHTNAIHQAYFAGKKDYFSNLEVEFINAKNSTHKLAFASPQDEGFHTQKETLKSILSESNAVVASFFGNAHNAFGLANFPNPFEFIFGPFDDYNSNKSAKTIPRSIVKTLLNEATLPINYYIQSLLSMTPVNVPVFHLETPPPIKSEAHIREFAGAYSKRIELCGVSPPQLRKKLYRLHGEPVEGYCKDQPIEYIPAPSAAFTKNGYLKAKYLPNDAAHGNAEYGKLVLEDILSNLQEIILDYKAILL